MLQITKLNPKIYALTVILAHGACINITLNLAADAMHNERN